MNLTSRNVLRATLIGCVLRRDKECSLPIFESLVRRRASLEEMCKRPTGILACDTAGGSHPVTDGVTET